LPNLVTSGAGARVEAARITNGGTCAIAAQTGGFASTNHAATGNCTVSVTAGVFGSAPFCTCSAEGNTNRSCTAAFNAATTTTIDVMTITSSTGAAADLAFSLICVGLR